MRPRTRAAEPLGELGKGLVGHAGALLAPAGTSRAHELQAAFVGGSYRCPARRRALAKGSLSFAVRRPAVAVPEVAVAQIHRHVVRPRQVGEEERQGRREHSSKGTSTPTSLIVSRARQLDVEHLAVAACCADPSSRNSGRRRAAPQIRHAEERVRAGGQIVQRCGPRAPAGGWPVAMSVSEPSKRSASMASWCCCIARVRRGHGGLLRYTGTW